MGAIWRVRGPGGFENNRQPPVTDALLPQGSSDRQAPPLEAGKTYTVVVLRKDPLGDADGFFNTRHRYAGGETFVATEP